MKTKHRIAAQHKRIQRDELTAQKTICRNNKELLTEQERAECSWPVRMSWEKVRTGIATGGDLENLSDAVSVCLLAAEEKHHFLEDLSQSAAAAICSIAERYERINRIGVDAAALRDIPQALDFYDELLRTATSGQLFGWMEIVMKIRGDAQCTTHTNVEPHLQTA